MPNHNYIRGRRREYEVIAKLKEEGYDLVVRTAGSRSPVDVIGIKSIPLPDGLGTYDTEHCKYKFVQVKSSKKVSKFKKEQLEVNGLKVEKWTFPTRKNAKNNRKRKTT